MTAVRPADVDAIEEAELGEEMNWSDPNSWQYDPPRIPREGEDVVIESHMNILFDIEQSPKLRSLEVNGRLTFVQGADRELRSYKIWVRGGELFIGSEH